MSRFKINRMSAKKEIEKCIICGEKATGRVSVDVDLCNFWFCKKHDFDVQMYVFMLLGNKADDAESWLSFAQKAAKKVLVRKPAQARSKNAAKRKRG